jgi:hypothetical protein
LIAKAVQRKPASVGFKRLAAYVLNEKSKGRGDPVDWQLAEYILDHGNESEKVAGHRVTNCISEDPGWAVKECLALAARNTRSTKDKSYHLVVSFPPGERPTEAQMIDIEDELVAAIGLQDHMRISATHQDKKHWHLHVAIVTVHPESFRNVTPYFDQRKLAEACIALEIKHNLTRTPHGRPPPGERALPAAAASLEARTGQTSFARWIAENAAVPLRTATAAANAWADMHQAFAEFGLTIKPRGAGLIVAGQTNDRYRMKASAIDRSLSFKALTDRLGAYEPPDPSIPRKDPTMSYTCAPRDANPGLWERYQQERDAALAARKQAGLELRIQQMSYFNELNAWHSQRYANAKAARLNLGDSISTRRTLDSDCHRDHMKRKAMEVEQRQKLKEAYTVPTWEVFLMREGSRGDRAALRTLERQVDAKIRTEAAASAEREGGRV